MSVIALAVVVLLSVVLSRLPSFSANASSVSSSLHPTLRYGSQGQAVKAVQSALNNHGAQLAIDGSFGPSTLTAVKSFQSSHGLAIDGIVGPNTWAALGSTSTPTPPSASSTSSLNRLGITQSAITGAQIHGYALDISKTTGMLYLLHDTSGSVQVVTSSVVSFAGCNSDGCFPTPNGIFHVLRKGGGDAISTKWRNLPMPWPLYYTSSGYAVHADPLGPSHGCTHVPNISQMKYINQHMPIGATIVIHS